MRRWFELWNCGDLDAFAGLFAAEAEVITDPSRMEAGPFRGRDAIRQWFEGLQESWDAEKLVVGELFEVDEKVVAHFNWEVHGRTSGIETKLDVTSLNTITDGEIVRQQYYFDNAEALKAVGLEECDVASLRRASGGGRQLRGPGPRVQRVDHALLKP